MKVIVEFGEYKPWSGAEETYDKIVAADLLDEFEAYCDEIFDGETTMTQINDLLRFEGDAVLEALGIAYESDDDLPVDVIVPAVVIAEMNDISLEELNDYDADQFAEVLTDFLQYTYDTDVMEFDYETTDGNQIHLYNIKYKW